METNRQLDRLRSIDIITLLSGRLVWRLMRGMARGAFDADYAGDPLAVCWFTNFSCNAQCHFCCKAAEIRAGKEMFPVLPLDKTQLLLEKIRRKVSLLYLSGGEPSIHPNIVDILQQAESLDFQSVGMSSNLIALDEKPEILDYIDAIGISIHSPSVKLHARNLGVAEKVAERVFANLELLKAKSKDKNIKVLVNCVITAENLSTVFDMVEFTSQHGFLLELVPANNKGHLPKELYDNAEYVSLINKLLYVVHLPQMDSLTQRAQ